MTPWTAAHQASLSITNSRSSLKLLSIESMMPSSHLILCHPLLLPSIFPSNRIFSSESALHIRWPKYWSFSLSISPSNEYSVLISYRIDWFDLHHCYIRQDIFTALKILYVLPIQPSLCQTLFKILLYPCSSSYSTISSVCIKYLCLYWWIVDGVTFVLYMQEVKFSLC